MDDISIKSVYVEIFDALKDENHRIAPRSMVLKVTRTQVSIRVLLQEDSRRPIAHLIILR